MNSYLEFTSTPRVLIFCFAASLILPVLMFKYRPSAIPLRSNRVEAKQELDKAKKSGELSSRLRNLLILDTLYPIAYVLFLSGIIHLAQPGWTWLALIPIALGIWDFCENGQLAWIHVKHPDYPQWLLDSALLFGKGNFIGFGICLIIAIACWLARFCSKGAPSPETF